MVRKEKCVFVIHVCDIPVQADFMYKIMVSKFTV